MTVVVLMSVLVTIAVLVLVKVSTWVVTVLP